jgi:hypothetical protein
MIISPQGTRDRLTAIQKYESKNESVRQMRPEKERRLKNRCRTINNGCHGSTFEQ